MPFEARNLRVQLPCGPVTVFPCRFNTVFCAYPTYITCGWWSNCRLFTWHCPFGSCLDSPTICRFGTIVDCGPGSPIADPGGGLCAASEPIQQVTHVSIEDLATLREQLQQQLKEVEAAEKKVQQYEKEQG
ncbi:MAG TPA: hypothetical protein VFB42_13150 [Gaiellaceae bacterium]|nr:hypothetical protein [Gaiellaceae bacterium]